MIDAKQIAAIIATYEKYGWNLRRILLSPPLRERLTDTIAQLTEGVKTVDSDLDAAWFSRTPETGPVAWEVRYLGETPYALLEYIDENGPDFENDLREVEVRLREYIARRKSA